MIYDNGVVLLCVFLKVEVPREKSDNVIIYSGFCPVIYVVDH